MFSGRSLSRLIAAAVVALGSSSNVAAQTETLPPLESLQNGDFSSGFTGFWSEYAQSSDLVAPGSAAVGSDPHLHNPFAPSFPDHTGDGARLMLLVNGVADLVAWRQSIRVVPETWYVFRGYVADWSNDQFGVSPTARIAVSINGLALGDGEVAVDPRDGVWTPFELTWYSGSAAVAAIRIVDLVADYNGNDFALDDLSFTPAAAPAVSTGPPAATDTRADLTAAVNPNGAATTLSFEYGVSTGYGAATVAEPVGAGTASVDRSQTLTGLSCGRIYHYRARAQNALGTMYGDDRVLTTSPCPPRVTSIEGSDRTLTVRVVANGDTAPILDYEYSLGENWVPRAPASPDGSLVIEGVANGVTYTVRVRAVNANGAGAASAAVQGTPATTPGAPTITSMTAGNAFLQVAFLAPASDGGAVVTHYEYSLDNGDWLRPASQTTTNVIVAGLVNGHQHAVRLRAINGRGAGPASNEMTGTPMTTPEAPIITAITQGLTWLAIAFEIPASGGSDITGYEVWNDERVAWIPVGTATPLLMTGLTSGRSYEVSLRAINAVGAGARSVPVRATPRRATDETVDDFSPLVNGTVLALTVSGEQVLIGGGFSSVTDDTGTIARRNLARLHGTGRVDATFDPKDIVAADSPVTDIVEQPDGKLLIATKGPPGPDRRHLGRLNANASLDGTRHPDGTITIHFQAAADDAVYALLLSGNKVLVGGAFTTLGTEADQKRRPAIGRVDAGGAADEFTLDLAVIGSDDRPRVHALTVDADGRVLIGGRFDRVAGVDRRNIARLNPDGSLDVGFNPGCDGLVTALAVDGGYVVVGGQFTTLAGATRHNVARLRLQDGGLDAGFVPPSRVHADAIVHAVLPLPNGALLVGGSMVAAPARDAAGARHLARFHADGSLDDNFEPNPDRPVTTLAMHGAGILVGGEFTEIGGEQRHGIARLGLPSASVPLPSAPPFADQPLERGRTPIRARHFLELRERIDALRRRFGLGPSAWTHPDLAGRVVQAVHLEELRERLLEAYTVAVAQGVDAALPAFGDDLSLAPPFIRAKHIQELRDAVQQLEVR